MAKKNKNYRDIFCIVLPELKEDFNEDILECKTDGLPKDYIYFYKCLEDQARSIGVGEILINKDIKEGKKKLYFSAYMRKLIYYGNKLENYLEEYSKDDFIFRFFDETDAIYCALISDNFKLVKELIDISGKRNDIYESTNIDSIYSTSILYSIKEIFMDNYDKAKFYVDSLSKISNDKSMKDYLQYEHIFRAIINRDEDTLNKYLNNLACTNSKLVEYKESPKELFSFATLGLAKLAILKGLNVKLDCECAPKEVLETDTIEYPDLSFLEL